MSKTEQRIAKLASISHRSWTQEDKDFIMAELQSTRAALPNTDNRGLSKAEGEDEALCGVRTARSWYIYADEKEKLEAELAATREDSARLDWLEKQLAASSMELTMKAGRPFHINHVVRLGNVTCLPVREAIDAARSKEKGEKSGSL